MPGEQLDLPIPTEPGQGLPARLAPMQPSVAAGPFDDPAYLFEPWWPGVRALAWIDGGRLVRLQAEGMADAMTAFAELGEELPERLTEDGVVLDGWLLALDDGGWLDTDLLRRRLAGELGAGRPGFVASDLLWSDGAPWHARPIRHPSRAPRQRAPGRRPLRRLPRAPRRRDPAGRGARQVRAHRHLGAPA